MAATPHGLYISRGTACLQTKCLLRVTHIGSPARNQALAKGTLSAYAGDEQEQDTADMVSHE